MRVSKPKLLHKYVQSTNIIEREELFKIGYNHVENALSKYSKKYNVKFIPVNYKYWEVVIPTS